MGESVVYKCFKEFMREYKKQIDIERKIANALEQRNKVVIGYDFGASEKEFDVNKEELK
jgi:hypothetical protein